MFEVELTVTGVAASSRTDHQSLDSAVAHAAQACIDARGHARARLWHVEGRERAFLDTIYGNGTGQAYANAYSG